MPGASVWRHRLRVAEAALLLLLAREIVARMPFDRWRRWFGTAASPTEPHSAALDPASTLRGRRVARAVGQAAYHLPGDFKCLPQAMAVCWMLRRRAIPASMVFGVADARSRGSLHDLHAWVSSGSDVIIGKGEKIHNPVLILR